MEHQATINPSTVDKRRTKGAGLLKLLQQRDLKNLFESEATDSRKRAQEILSYEKRLSAMVNAAYQLTQEEVELLWKTAPPRMPKARP